MTQFPAEDRHPADHRWPPRGVRESLEDQTMAMAQPHRGAAVGQAAPSRRQAVECVIADTTHRRRGRGGRLRREVRRAPTSACRSRSRRAGATAARPWTWTRCRRRRSGASTAPNGPGAVYLAAVLAGAHPEGAARVRDLRPRRAGRRRHRHPADVRGEASALRPRRRWPSLSCAASPISSVGNVSMGIAGSIVDHDFFECYLGMRVETVDMTEVRPPHRQGHLRQGRARPRARVGRQALPRGRGPERQAAFAPTTSGESCARA